MKKKYLTTSIIFLVIYILLVSFFLNFTNNIFEPLLYNNPSFQINEWDLLQITFGYYTVDIQNSMSYLDLKNITHLLIPICIQLINILISIYFLKIPLSFHIFIKTRIHKKRTYYFFFLKKSILLNFIFIVILGVATLTFIKLSPFSLTESSFSYQSGSFYLSLILYLMTQFLMTITYTLFIFWSYLKGNSLLGIAATFISLTLLNISDRVLTNLNFILFDNQHMFIDSIITWLFLITIASFILKKEKLYQEDYND